jgi:hypothetical protein
MKKLLLFSLFVIINYKSNAQSPRIKVDADDKLSSSNAAVGSPIMTADFIGFRNPPSVDLNWQPYVTAFSNANSSEDDELLQKIKEEKNKLKWSSTKKEETTDQLSQISSSLVPSLGTNFIGISNGGNNTPLDNTIAISNGGIIVIAVNPKVEYRDTTGKVLYSQTLATLVGDNTLPMLCDPKVVYDSGDDRFIFFAQTCDGGATPSKVILGFSKTNNPTAGWYFYQLNGNPLNDGSWFDYPKMAVSNNELFVTGNLFKTSGGSFNQSVIYEVNKKGGYSGTATLTWKYWSAIVGSPFTVLPAGNGQQGNYGPGMYFVSTSGNTSGSTNINLYELTDDMTNTSAKMNRFTVTTTQYKVAGNSAQSGTTIKLATGDCRTLDGFYLNGIIHFVFQTDIGSGWLGIAYNRLTVSTAKNVVSTHGNMASSIDYAYPSVASFGTSITDKSVVIAYGRSGASKFPETAVVACDDSMNWSTDLLVRKGDNYVDYSWYANDPERWGDYSGIWRKQNASVPTAWMAAEYGTSGKIWGQWVAKITSNKTPTGIQNITAETGQSVVYPNPITDTYSLDFVLNQNETLIINILDLQGRVVKELYNGGAVKGRNLFTFNKAQLNSGVYFVNIRSNALKTIKNEKIVISGN